MRAPQPGAEGYPRLAARARRGTLGIPRAFGFRSEADGDAVAEVLYLRSAAGDDPVHALWALDVATGGERLVADPRALVPDDPDADLPPEERARRERVRESGGGIVAYATDRRGTLAAFALGGRLLLCDVASGEAVQPAVDGPVVDPRPDPTGRRVAYVRRRALWVVDVEGRSAPDRLLGEADDRVSWGLAEFVAAEEMDRTRGFWWAPDGERLVVARVDEAPVQVWHLADPANPQTAPTAVRYPAAGTANADVQLWIVDLHGSRTAVAWDRTALPYVVDVVWGETGPLTVVVQSRDQRTVAYLTVDEATGATTAVRTEVADPWVDLVPGNPRWVAGDGGPARLVSVVADGDVRALAVDGSVVSPPGCDVRRVVAVDLRRAIVAATGDDAAAVDVWSVPLDGGAPRRLSTGGVADAAAAGDVVVLAERTLAAAAPRVTVLRGGDSAADRDGVEAAGGEGGRGVRGLQVAVHALDLGLELRVELAALGPRELPAALLLPRAWTPDDGPLPVLLDPYGGPHAQRVVRAAGAHLASQWFAEQGYAVLVVDGRGTPGKGLAWEQAVHGDLASLALEDQVDGLHAAADRWPGALDLGRVAIRGWSFGGYLAALAVLRRPDAVHAAIAGAPVTDMALYDTHYTERYLGTPQDAPEAYRRSSLLEDAARLERPLLLIHGLADDNVVVAHTLRFSSALLAAGRPHRVLPLSGVTHMTPQEVVAENLLRLQAAFLEEAIGAWPTT